MLFGMHLGFNGCGLDPCSGCYPECRLAPSGNAPARGWIRHSLSTSPSHSLIKLPFGPNPFADNGVRVRGFWPPGSIPEPVLDEMRNTTLGVTKMSNPTKTARRFPSDHPRPPMRKDGSYPD